MRIKAVLLAAVILISFFAGHVSAAGGGTGNAVYENTSELLEGFTYTNEISFNALGNREEAFILTLRPNSSVYPVFMPCDKVYGGMTLTEAISYYESLGKTVVGGVNSDYFAYHNQMPLGISIENGIFKSGPEDENIFALDENGYFFLEKTSIKPRLNIQKPDGSCETVSFKHFNKGRNNGGGLYLMTEDFSDRTHTFSDGWAVIFKVKSGEYRLCSEVIYEVDSVIPEGDDYEIGEGKAVLTCDATSMRDDIRDKFTVGDTVTLSFDCADERLKGAIQAVGCGDLLVSDGEITDQKAWDEAIQSTNPRTAVGVGFDGELILYALDGKQSGYSAGANMLNLAKDLQSKKLKFAVNLDGGGSTTFAVKLPGMNTAQVVNKPSGVTERSCGAFILLVADVKKEGVPVRAHLKEDGVFLLRGSSMELHCIFTDDGLNVLDIENANTSFISSGLGSVTDGIYKAGAAEGTDTVEITSGTGIKGRASIHIVSELSADFTLLDEVTGKAPVLTNLEEGCDLSFSGQFKVYGRSVSFDEIGFIFSVSPNVGFISEEGEYVVTGLPGREGILTVTIGEMSKEYKTGIYCSFSDLRTHWSSGYVESLYREGIVSGTGSGKFNPDGKLKRCDFVVMLWRSMGKPAPNESGIFTDVPADSYYASAVDWACERGITKGTGSGKFSPDGNLTREQAFTLIYRAFFSDSDKADSSVLKEFSDYEKISAYAANAASFLVQKGIVNGAKGKLSPKALITRAEIAKLLCVSIYNDYVSVISVG